MAIAIVQLCDEAAAAIIVTKAAEDYGVHNTPTGHTMLRIPAFASCTCWGMQSATGIMESNDRKAESSMQDNRMPKEIIETLQILDDIREINDVLSKEQNGYGFDRQKAQSIIDKHNRTDPYVCFANNYTPNTIPLVYATNDTLRNNLIMIRMYLCTKHAQELTKKSQSHQL